MTNKPKLCTDCDSHYISTQPWVPTDHMCSQGQEPVFDPVDGSVTYDQLKTCKMRRDSDACCGPRGLLWTSIVSAMPEFPR